MRLARSATKQATSWLKRNVRGPFASLIAFFAVATLIDALLIQLLTPLMGQAARSCTWLLVVAGAWRAGVPGGIAAALIQIPTSLYVTYIAAGDSALVNDLLVRILPNACLQLLVGILIGRMHGLGDRLKLELVERKRMVELLRESEECYRMLFESNPHPMWVVESHTFRFLAVNDSAVQHYGFSADEFAAMTVKDLLLAEDVPLLLEYMSHPLPVFRHLPDWKHRKRDGTVIDVEIRVHEVSFQGYQARLVLANDVTEGKRAKERLEHQAMHDALTGLPNRALLQNYLEQAIASARRNQTSFAMLVVDLDRFKEINDTLGHPYGDIVLQEISPRFRQVLREVDLMARLGGDEFAIILPEADERGAALVTERLLAGIKVPFVLEDEPYDVGASIGIAVYPQHGEDPATLLRAADMAMYTAKKSAGGYVVYAADRIGGRTRAVPDPLRYIQTSG
jgi:diguanylate cyclase (GGDEF)-like protein/PAS domain S-box-containing protein